MGKDPQATIEMDNGGRITVELYPSKAPNTVNNFIYLARKGFYDSVIFHRVIPGFMIQGGDPYGNGTGGPSYSIRGEFEKNGFPNDLKHKRGVVAMARSEPPDSAGSQFFILVADSPHLDGEYAAFGRVIEGMDVVDRIANARRDRDDRPFDLHRIRTVTVDTFGEEYPAPEVIT